LSARDKRFPRKDTCLAIYSQRVNTLRPLAKVLEAQWPWCREFEPDLTRLFRSYVERKQALAVLDYDDLLLYWHGLLAEPALARRVGALFDHVLVDEYQDTNLLQAEDRARAQAGRRRSDRRRRRCAVHLLVPAASIENILGFPAQFAPAATVIALEQNYRSTQADTRWRECVDR